MNHIQIVPVATEVINGFISFFIQVAVLFIILKIIMYSFEKKLKEQKRENKNKGYIIKKYNTNTIILGIIAVCLTFLVIHKIYEEIMINIAVNNANKKMNNFNEAMEKLNIEENKSLKNINSMMGQYGNVKNSFDKTNKKIQIIPKVEMQQIEIPKVDTQKENQIKNIDEEIKREKERVKREMMN